MLKKQTPTMQRALWLHEAEEALRGLFKAKGYKVPAEVRTSWGFPKGSKGGHKGTVIGQCWFSLASSDQHNELFLSPALGHAGKPTLDDSVIVLATHAHELAHSICGKVAGHRIIREAREGERNYDSRVEKHRMSFPVCAAAIGLEGPWTATTAGPEFVKWAKEVVHRIGYFPAGKLENFARKKDTNRQLKCECEDCGYIVRTTKKWIEAAGPPICPTDETKMVCDALDDEE